MNIYFTHAKSLANSWGLYSASGVNLSSDFGESVLEALGSDNDMIDDGILDALHLGFREVLFLKIGFELGDRHS